MSYYFDEQAGGYIINASNKFELLFTLIKIAAKNIPFYLIGIIDGGLLQMTVTKNEENA